MYRKVFLFLCLLYSTSGWSQATETRKDTMLLEPVELMATRATEKMPVAKTNLNKAAIARMNTVADLPYIVSQLPNVQVNSDAGNGVGYTGIRIRGTDASRINVTINGIPYNDAESQGTFFVNLPDISSSASSIQVQRGVGTSTQGPASFGASINLSTQNLQKESYVSLDQVIGAFQTFRNTIQANSGLIGRHWLFYGRMSHIRSEGYIDRASSKLASYYASASWADSFQQFSLNVFTGKEKTYQAWYGIDQGMLDTNRTFNAAGTEKPGDPYDNETDNYRQTHYQFFWNRAWASNWKSSVGLFYTRGKGYYEQYKANQALSDYGLPHWIQGSDTVSSSDMIRQLWLDNDFYGGLYSVQYTKGPRQIIAGGGFHEYLGRHFGIVQQLIEPIPLPNEYKWYNLDAKKTEASQYLKWTESLNSRWSIFADIQYRYVDYQINGFRNNPQLLVHEKYHFLNPKAGFSFQGKKTRYYAYYGQAGKEPNRDDFEIATSTLPKREKLHNVETGFESRFTHWNFSVNLYYMKYRDQLVLTGKINDVGAYTRTNIPNSYRLGIEWNAQWKPWPWLTAEGNISVSRNRLRNFTEYIDDYDAGGQKTNFYKETDIAFSPSVIGGYTLLLVPARSWEISTPGKYVGRQYLDNTANEGRRLNAYFVQDIRVRYEKKTAGLQWHVFAQVHNLFSERYEANGYTFSYFLNNQLQTANYFYPMAPIHWSAGLGIRL